MTVVFWVDAGPTFGLGHVSRGLALAEALGARGVACRFVLEADPTALAWIAAAKLPAPLVVPPREPALPRVLAAVVNADAVVVDVQHPLAAAEVRALGGTRPVLVVDDAGPGAREADLVLAPFAPAGARDPRVLAGPEHVPLRRAVAAAGGRPRRPAGHVPTVLVSMGASDPGGLTVPAVEAVGRARAAGARLTARVVANPASPVWKALPALLRALDLPPACAVEPDRTAEHLAAADLALVAMGVTVYEAMAAGVPPLVVCRTSGDAAHARALEQRGGCTSLGQHWTVERAAAALATLAGDPERLAAMGRVGRGLVDGRGAERAAARLLALLGGAETADAGERARA